jgi:hypothetical protein
MSRFFFTQDLPATSFSTCLLVASLQLKSRIIKWGLPRPPMGIEIENGRLCLRLLSLKEITAKLRGLSFAEAAKHLGDFDSYDRTGAMVCVMLRAPTPADQVRVFLDWGNACDAPWPYRGLIADLLRQACAEVSMPDLLEPADRQFYSPESR